MPGFPHRQTIYIDTELNLAELLTPHPAATFYVRVRGNTMAAVGILNNDIVVVDRSLNPLDGDIVIATCNGELLLRQLIKRGRRLHFASENEKDESIPITDQPDIAIWGVVSGVVRKLRA